MTKGNPKTNSGMAFLRPCRCWPFCGLLLETEAGGVYFAYPFTLGEEEGAEITERVYAAFYPDALDDS